MPAPTLPLPPPELQPELIFSPSCRASTGVLRISPRRIRRRYTSMNARLILCWYCRSRVIAFCSCGDNRRGDSKPCSTIRERRSVGPTGFLASIFTVFSLVQLLLSHASDCGGLPCRPSDRLPFAERPAARAILRSPNPWRPGPRGFDFLEVGLSLNVVVV